MAITLALLIPLHLVDPSVLFLLTSNPNNAPQVIPALREWHGGSGSFMLNPASQIVVDSADASQLQETASVFEGDLFVVTGKSLPVVTANAPQKGDFFLTLKSSDRGIGNEGYLFEVADATAIYAHTSAGGFYGTRTALLS